MIRLVRKIRYYIRGGLRAIKDSERVGLLESILFHLFNAILVCLVAYKAIFVNVSPDIKISMLKSMIICMLSCSLIGIVVRLQGFLTYISSISDVIIGLGIFCILNFGSSYISLLRTLLIIFIIVSVVGIYCIFSRKRKGLYIHQIPDKDIKRRVIFKRIFKSADMVGIIFGFLCVFIIVPSAYNTIVYGGITSKDTDIEIIETGYMPADSSENYYDNLESFDENYTENEYSLSSNFESISKIRYRDTWEPLTDDEKLAVLQDISDCECNYLGMTPGEIVVTVDDLSGGVLAHYNEIDKLITIDRTFLQEGQPKVLLNSVLHEIYHAYEHMLVYIYINATPEEQKLRIFMRCDDYLEECLDYQEGVGSVENYELYYNQALEEDARAYASEMAEEYYDEIDTIMAERLKNENTNENANANENANEGVNENETNN